MDDDMDPHFDDRNDNALNVQIYVKSAMVATWEMEMFPQMWTGAETRWGGGRKTQEQPTQ